MDISSNLAVGISAAVAIIYTLMGGLYSVAYTDVIQLSLVLFGLVRTLRFIKSYGRSSVFDCATFSTQLFGTALNDSCSSSSSSLQWFCVPFILTSPTSANITVAAVTKLYQEPWIGKIESDDIGRWIDELLLLVKGNKKQPPALPIYVKHDIIYHVLT